MKYTLKISHQITMGLFVILILALTCIYAVVEFKVAPDLISENQKKIAVNQQALNTLLTEKLEKIELLTSSLANLGETLPKDEGLFKKA
ncbi:MAG: hypothetical protein ACTIM4_15640 [Marinomonas sp.]